MKNQVLELRARTDAELKEMIIQKRNQLRQLLFDLESGKVKNLREIRSAKKEIARILTILKENEKNLKPAKKLSKDL